MMKQLYPRRKNWNVSMQSIPRTRLEAICLFFSYIASECYFRISGSFTRNVLSNMLCLYFLYCYDNATSCRLHYYKRRVTCLLRSCLQGIKRWVIFINHIWLLLKPNFGFKTLLKFLCFCLLGAR